MDKYQLCTFKYGISNLTVDRKIFAAPYLCDKIIDYEIFCFNSKPKFIRVQKLLFENNHTFLHNYYNLDWE